MKDTHLSQILELRLVVGLLGEKAQNDWWPTAFFDASSHLFLEPAFPKTFRLAQYHGVVEAARRLHDEHLNLGSYHLFRVPEEVEQDLHGMMKDDEKGKSSLTTQADALEALARIAGGKSKSNIGPVSIGSFADLSSASVIKAIAGAYLTAFSEGHKTYPYLTN
jgi:hypothetical protein